MESNNLKKFLSLQEESNESMDNINSKRNPKNKLYNDEAYIIKIVDIDDFDKKKDEKLSFQLKDLYGLKLWYDNAFLNNLDKYGRTCHNNDSLLLPELNVPEIIVEQNVQRISFNRSHNIAYINVKDKKLFDNLKSSKDVHNLFDQFGKNEKIETFPENLTKEEIYWSLWAYTNFDKKHTDSHPSGYMEFTQTSEVADGRIILDYKNHKLYWTATHYTPFCIDHTGHRQLYELHKQFKYLCPFLNIRFKE